MLKESSLNRVYQHSENFDIACITAFRKQFIDETNDTFDDRPKEYLKAHPTLKDRQIEPYEYSLEENKKRNKTLKTYLLNCGYGVTSIDGTYIENYGKENAIKLNEDSFLVVNLKNASDFYDSIFFISEYFNQDSFIYKAKGEENAVLIGTNNSDAPGYKEKVTLGPFRRNVDTEFLSGLKNSTFSFYSGDAKQKTNRDSFSNLDSKKSINEKTIYLESMTELSIMGKMAISTMAKPLMESYLKYKNKDLLKETKEKFQDFYNKIK